MEMGDDPFDRPVDESRRPGRNVNIPVQVEPEHLFRRMFIRPQGGCRIELKWFGTFVCFFELFKHDCLSPEIPLRRRRAEVKDIDPSGVRRAEREKGLEETIQALGLFGGPTGVRTRGKPSSQSPNLSLPNRTLAISASRHETITHSPGYILLNRTDQELRWGHLNGKNRMTLRGKIDHRAGEYSI